MFCIEREVGNGWHWVALCGSESVSHWWADALRKIHPTWTIRIIPRPIRISN